MADIELVIKIPEEEYRWIKKSDKMVFADVASKECMLHAIKNGVPLPKGHGNFVDISELMDMLCLEDNAYNRDNNVAELITLEDIDRLDVIIPADKEAE